MRAADLKIALYDPYLSTLGGGENLLAVFAELLEAELPTASIDILVHDESTVGIDSLASRFGVTLDRTRVRVLPGTPRARIVALQPLWRFRHERYVGRISAEYDVFVNHTIFSVAPPRARHSIYMCMFPLDPAPTSANGTRSRRALLRPYIALRRALYRRWVGQYSLLLAISEFTQDWIRRYWRLESHLLYPPVMTASSLSLARKGKRILAVGRFFPGNHNKKHDVLIAAFAACRQAGLDGWELHLVGGRTDVPGTDAYIAALQEQAAGQPVHFHVDAGHAELRELQKTSSLFWHATGYGEDQTLEPEKLEHFGMSTVEAMTHGCVPLVHACGGQPEIVEGGVSGYLWTSPEELCNLTLGLVRDHSRRRAMAEAAHRRSQRFGREAFRASARELLAGLLAPA